METAQNRQKEKHLKSTKTVEDIRVGNFVLIYNAKSKGRQGGPMEADFTGSYEVIRVTGKKCKLRKDGTELKRTVSMDHLKLQ